MTLIDRHFDLCQNQTAVLRGVGLELELTRPRVLGLNDAKKRATAASGAAQTSGLKYEETVSGVKSLVPEFMMAKVGAQLIVHTGRCNCAEGAIP